MFFLLRERRPGAAGSTKWEDIFLGGSGLGEGVFEGGALGGEHLAAGLGDVPVVFEADAELTGEVDAGFVGEAHTRGERGGVAPDEIGPLVAVHADAVTEAVGEVLVVGAESCGGDDVASGGVDGLALDSGACGGEGGGLGPVDDVEDLAGLVKFREGGVAEDEGAGDVGLVAFDGAAVVDEDDLALTDGLGLQGAVRKGGVFADLAARVAGDAAAGVGEVDEPGELAVGHAGLGGFVTGFVDGEGDVVGELHEGQLGGSFDGAAAEGDRRGASGGEGRAGVGDTVGEDELGALFDAEAAGAEAGFLEGFREKVIGVFVFVPRVDTRCGG
jgi:hypothetical protein